MKKNHQKKIERIVYNTSFQTQLFLIILAVFILFLIGEYLIVSYSFRGRYIKSEIDDDNSKVSSFLLELNATEISGTNILKPQENFMNSSGAYLVCATNKTGGFVLLDTPSQYIVTINSNSIDYTVIVEPLSLEMKVDDIVDASIHDNEDGTYSFVTLSINGDPILSNNLLQGETISIAGGTITSVVMPSNFNYLYRNTTLISDSLNTINSNITKLVEVRKTNNSPYNKGYYYLNEESSMLYCIYQPRSFEQDVFFIAIFSLVRTSSITTIISSYYGYVVLISIVISVIIAVFISRSFSRPIRNIEEEITKITNDDYSLSSYTFRNKEMVSLQDTINAIKIDTKNKVASINEQKESLRLLNEELKNESDLRASFIARLSHELKTPLMVISATTEALEDGVIPENEIMSNYETILEEVEKTTKIIKDIIGTYKTESSGKAKLNITRFNLADLVREILNPLLPLAAKKRLVVDTDLSVNAFMDADKELISHAISNFITNAFKYTENEGTVTISIIDDKENYTFEVKNYGAHIEEENLKKIFLPFFRENENVDQTSTGMGLYIVKEILENHKLDYGVTNFDEGVVSYFKIKK